MTPQFPDAEPPARAGPEPPRPTDRAREMPTRLRAARTLIAVLGAASLVTAAVLIRVLWLGTPSEVGPLGEWSPAQIYRSYASAAAQYGVISLAVAAVVGWRSMAAYVCIVILQVSALLWTAAVLLVGTHDAAVGVFTLGSAVVLYLIKGDATRAYYRNDSQGR